MTDTPPAVDTPEVTRPTLPDLDRRVGRLEKHQLRAVFFWLQFLLIPALLVLLGFWLNSRLEATKRAVQEAQLEVSRVNAAQTLLDEVFSGVPERAFMAERLLGKVLDAEMASELRSTMVRYYSYEMETSKSRADDAQRLENATRAIGGQAARQVAEEVLAKEMYVVLTTYSEKEKAVSHAMKLKPSYDGAAVFYRSSSGYAVVLGRASLPDAKRLRDEAVLSGDAPLDAYVVPLAGYTAVPLNGG